MVDHPPKQEIDRPRKWFRSLVSVCTTSPVHKQTTDYGFVLVRLCIDLHTKIVLYGMTIEVRTYRVEDKSPQGTGEGDKIDFTIHAK
jgi:hypothetical protein